MTFSGSNRGADARALVKDLGLRPFGMLNLAEAPAEPLEAPPATGRASDEPESGTSSESRSAIAFAMDGSLSSRLRSAADVSSRVVTGVPALTVADLGPPSITATSPKYPPEDRRTRSTPPAVTVAVPLVIT